MKYIEYMAKKKLFTLKDIYKLTMNLKTAKNILSTYVKQGYIKRIRQDYYVYIDLASKLPVVSKFEIASNISNETYVSYHSAFEYYGIANQVFYEVTVSTSKRFRSFMFENISYNLNISKIEKGIESDIRDELVKVTSIERTIVDSIYDFDKAGGFEEVIDCISLVRNVDDKKILEILDEYNTIFLYQKVGFILECYKDKLKISDAFFKKCKDKITKKKQYMIPNEKGQEFIKTWNLYVPKSMLKLVNKENNIIV